jgi:hypothetical protein
MLNIRLSRKPKGVAMEITVSLLLIDNSWIEGTWIVSADPIGVLLTDVYKSKPYELETGPFAKEVFVPWTSILLKVNNPEISKKKKSQGVCRLKGKEEDGSRT